MDISAYVFDISIYGVIGQFVINASTVGPTGLQGIQGITGHYGVDGSQGIQGIQGIQGLNGLFAGQGIQGIQGIQGNQGQTGVQGIQGIQGSQGYQGDTGLQGIQGIPGVNGTNGINGVNGTFTDIINSTQMSNAGGILNILESWLYSLFYSKSEIDTKISTSNLHAHDASNITNVPSSWTSTYNATYDTKVTDNSSWNQALATTLYADIKWNYNQSTAAYNMYNAQWASTYNATYDTWSYNQTSPAITYSDTKSAPGNCPAGQVVQNTTISGVQCITPSASGGLTPVYLGSNLNATSAAYTTIFTIALTHSKMNVVQVYLAQSSSANGVAIQNRAIANASGPVGNCNFVTQTGAGAEAVDNIAVSTNSADTGVTAMTLDANVPFLDQITCTVLADANQENLIIQFDSETAANVTTYAGSYYTNAVN